MKNYFYFMNNERGFYLPIVLIVSVVTLSALITTIQIYKNEVVATNLLLQQLDLSMMKDITIQRFKSEVNFNEIDIGEFEFKLDNNHSYGEYEVIDGEVRVTFHIETDDLGNSYFYSFKLKE